jgi:hypothetical protein
LSLTQLNRQRPIPETRRALRAPTVGWTSIKYRFDGQLVTVAAERKAPCKSAMCHGKQNLLPIPLPHVCRSADQYGSEADFPCAATTFSEFPISISDAIADVSRHDMGARRCGDSGLPFLVFYLGPSLLPRIRAAGRAPMSLMPPTPAPECWLAGPAPQTELGNVLEGRCAGINLF